MKELIYMEEILNRRIENLNLRIQISEYRDVPTDEDQGRLAECISLLTFVKEMMQ